VRDVSKDFLGIPVSVPAPSIPHTAQGFFAITVTFLDIVVFVRTLEVFGFGNSFILSLESLPIDLRARPANMVVIHSASVKFVSETGNDSPISRFAH
jgi:hypothetical protein